jgi:hypothetical protein
MSRTQIEPVETLFDVYHAYMAEENYTAALLIYYVVTEADEQLLLESREPPWYEDSNLFHA